MTNTEVVRGQEGTKVGLVSTASFLNRNRLFTACDEGGGGEKEKKKRKGKGSYARSLSL